MGKIIIIGAGLAGLSAAAALADRDIPCLLVSAQPSERAQSVLAAGGINAALDTMGEGDRVEDHEADTLRAGVMLADPEAVRHLAQGAPDVIRYLVKLGVPFNSRDGRLVQRNFGGQKKKRTCYAKSSTGKIIMNALIDEVRKHESRGLVTRYPHHELLGIVRAGTGCAGARIRDSFSGEILLAEGPVILACGGLNGFFPGITTGTAANTGDAAARLFAQGVRFSCLEMIQYHPTTIGIAGKRCLVSEAARGEGGRLFAMRGGIRWYFMEEKYPELGNLMPRDVVSREMAFVLADPACGGQVYLDLTGLPDEIWTGRLPDLRDEIRHYLSLDPRKEPVPVDPGIHYFMGGIDVDADHRTNIPDLYAAGECCSQYHGANRLGGNSMLGAVFGGRTAAASAAEGPGAGGTEHPSASTGRGMEERFRDRRPAAEDPSGAYAPSSPAEAALLGKILSGALGIVRNGEALERGLASLREREAGTEPGTTDYCRLKLGEAMIRSALVRKESRGAHFRSDFPGTEQGAPERTTAEMADGTVRICMEPVGAH